MTAIVKCLQGLVGWEAQWKKKNIRYLVSCSSCEVFQIGSLTCEIKAHVYNGRPFSSEDHLSTRPYQFAPLLV